MEEELHATDFVDYHLLFSRALTHLGKGMSVPEAVESCLKEEYPHTYKDILTEAKHILARLRKENDWGSVRALRELANVPELAERIRGEDDEDRAFEDMERARRPDAVADYPRIFALAQLKRQSGFSLSDSLEMAVRELYPQTFRKVKKGASFYVRLASYRRGIHELRALRELAEDKGFFAELERSLPE
jgi:hypothetical protein